MFDSMDVFRVSGQLMRHAGQRQALAAVNVANADTPGFRAQALPSFAEAAEGGGPRATRAGHLGGGDGAAARPFDAPGESSPNGNTVSIEQEMWASAQATREHNQALAAWRHGLTVLRTAMGAR